MTLDCVAFLDASRRAQRADTDADSETAQPPAINSTHWAAVCRTYDREHASTTPPSAAAEPNGCAERYCAVCGEPEER